MKTGLSRRRGALLLLSVLLLLSLVLVVGAVDSPIGVNDGVDGTGGVDSPVDSPIGVDGSGGDSDTIGFESLPGGTATTDGMLLTTQYGSFGVEFVPQENEDAGAVVAECRPGNSECEITRSGDKVIAPIQDTEFDFHPLEMRFDRPQNTVSIYVKHPRVSTNNRVTVSVEARDGSGRTVDTHTNEFREQDGWQELVVDSGEAPEIKRVFIREEGGTAVPNDLFFDNLSFERSSTDDGGNGDNQDDGGDSDGGGEFVDEPPSATLISTGPGVDRDGKDHVIFSASDDVQLKNVTLRVTDPSGRDITTTPNPICGTRFSPCPPGTEVLDTTRTQRYSDDGLHTIRVRACDTNDTCTETQKSKHVDVPDPEPEPYVYRVEVNQGVQNELLDPPGHGTADTASLRLPLVPNKDTVVRFYLFSDNGTTTYTPGNDLKLVVNKRDGGFEENWIDPNTGQSRVRVPEMPTDPDERQKKLLEMRGDPGMSLNYVVPRDMLPSDASSIQLNVERETGPLKLDVGRNGVIGFDLVGLYNDTYAPPDRGRVDGLVTMHRYLLPASDVAVANAGRWVSIDDTGRPVRTYTEYTGDTECSEVLSWVRSTYAGDTAATGGVEPDYVVTVGVAGFGTGLLEDCLGKAYLGGTPTAVSYVDTNVAPQEVVHTMGLTHASHYHGVRKQNQSWEDWPYPHGQMSASTTYTRGGENYGVVPNKTSDGGAGEYELVVIDPCPTSDPDERYPTCSIPDGDQAHDFMSYGPGKQYSALEPLFGHDTLRWASDVTYQRTYHAIRSGSPNPESESLPNETLAGWSGSGSSPVLLSSHESGEDRVEAFMVAGREAGDGLELVHPLLRKQLPAGMVHMNASRNGERYTLRFLDGDGRETLRHHFDVTPTSHHGEYSELFWEAVPYREDAERLVIDRDGRTVLDVRASPGVPVVEVTGPDGGEVVESGSFSVSWRASDPDDDPLTHLVQYSMDGGETWQGVTTVMPGHPNTAELEVEGFAPGTRGVVRVTSSDGFNTAYDVSDGYFSLGTDEQPAEGSTEQIAEEANERRLEERVGAVEEAGGEERQPRETEPRPTETSTEDGGDAGAPDEHVFVVVAALILGSAVLVYLGWRNR